MLILNGLFLTALAAASTGFSADEPTGGEKIQQGLEGVKEGSKEVAKGVGDTAERVGERATEVGKKVGETASEAGQKVGRAFKAATCPIVGDRKTKLYYAADSKSYEAVLSGQKYFEDDDRACFMTERAARDEGYTRSAN